MNYLQNHIWCHDSNWGGKFDCRHTVFFNSYGVSDKEDWAALIDPNAETIFDEERFNSMVKMLTDRGREFDPEDFRENYNRSVYNLKPEVLEWLDSNVPDLNADKFDNGHCKAWAVGSTAYRAGDSASSFGIFFQRRRDAMAFIKRWSKWKKPVYYCQYFTDVRKKLNLETLKYEPH